jgi:hypothetical protein
VIGILINFDLLVLFTDDKNQAAMAPIITTANGLSFKVNGKINIEVLIGGIHDIALPATIDRVDKANIGFTMFNGSCMLINDGPR